MPGRVDPNAVILVGSFIVLVAVPAGLLLLLRLLEA